MKSWYVHYLNKFPGGHTFFGETELVAFDASGKPRVRCVKNGAGMWTDVSEELGLPDRHDLAPIPRETRVWKLTREGKVERDEEADTREKVALGVASYFGGRVPGAFEILQLAGLKPDPRDSRLVRWEMLKDERLLKAAPKLMELAAPKEEAPVEALALEANPPIPTEGRVLS